MEKMKTPAKKKLKTTFKESRQHSSDMRDYRDHKYGSIQMEAKSSMPDPTNRADFELNKLVSKKGVFPSQPDRYPKKDARKGIRYKWRDSGPGRNT